MKITATYFLSGQYMGESTFECDMLPHSLAFFCATCGEVWGRIICTTPGQSPHWSVDTCPCTKHERSGVPDWSKIPGTIGQAFYTTHELSKMWWGQAVEHLPPEVLKQEFLRVLNYYEKELQYD